MTTSAHFIKPTIQKNDLEDKYEKIKNMFIFISFYFST